MQRNVHYLEVLVLWAIISWCTTVSAAGAEQFLPSLGNASLSFTIVSPSLNGAALRDKTAALSELELLDYDPTELVSQHERLRRGAAESSTIRFSFSAFNKYVCSS